MVLALRSHVVWGASPTTCGSVFRFAVRNPRSRRKADPALDSSESPTESAARAVVGSREPPGAERQFGRAVHAPPGLPASAPEIAWPFE